MEFLHAAIAAANNSVVERMRTSMEHFLAAWEDFLTAFLAFLPHLLQALIILLIGYFAVKLIPKPIGKMLGKTAIDPVAVKYLLRVVRVSLWY